MAVEPEVAQQNHRAAPAPGAASTGAPSVAEVIVALDAQLRSGALDQRRPTPTGFDPLDDLLNGGFRRGDLALIGGAQGVGKTTLAFQIARNAAASGATAISVCFEHDVMMLANRLVALESAGFGSDTPTAALTTAEIERLLLHARRQEGGNLAGLVAAEPRLRAAFERIMPYSDRLCLVAASSRETTLGKLAELVTRAQETATGPVMLFVDYLQKVPLDSRRESREERERIFRVAEGLKELALRRETAVVAVVACDEEGQRTRHLRAHHLMGGAGLAYEADQILLLSEKFDRVAKVHKEFNAQKAQAFKEWVILAVEKNRAGQGGVNLEFRKRFKHCAFDPSGHFVAERLDDE